MEIEGFPHAVVVDSVRLMAVHKANEAKFKELEDEELEGFNKAWWNCTVLAGELRSVWMDLSRTAHKGVAEKVSGGWDKLRCAFRCIADDSEGEEQAEIDVALKKADVEAILDANVRFAGEYANGWGKIEHEHVAHASLENRRFQDLNWLSYAVLPGKEQAKATAAKTASPVVGASKAKNEALNELNDGQFMKEFLVSGTTPPHHVANVQLKRAIENGFDVNAPNTQLWLRFLSILCEHPDLKPEWLKSLPETARENAKTLANSMLDAPVPAEKRWKADKAADVVMMIDQLEYAKASSQPNKCLVPVEDGKNNKKEKKDKKEKAEPPRPNPKKRVTASGNSSDNPKRPKAPKKEKEQVVLDNGETIATAVLDSWTLETIEKLGDIAEDLDLEKLDAQMENATSKLNSIESSFSSMNSTVQSIQTQLQQVQALGGQREQNISLEDRNKALTTKLKLAKAALQILARACTSGGASTSDADNPSVMAVKDMLSIPGIGFEKEELDVIFGKAKQA